MQTSCLMPKEKASITVRMKCDLNSTFYGLQTISLGKMCIAVSHMKSLLSVHKWDDTTKKLIQFVPGFGIHGEKSKVPQFQKIHTSQDTNPIFPLACEYIILFRYVESLDLKSECILVSAMGHLPQEWDLFFNKCSKVVLNEKGLCVCSHVVCLLIQVWGSNAKQHHLVWSWEALHFHILYHCLLDSFSW